ncbi:unnamed protein product [Lactuca virosa]|uniref:Uncharacterized protein n=1 Tax=Lactuca virosa TaxID=75947 RepID=A0AAU9LEF7_9ASTR|nr:unnamed protein product [Lactuca virosa]
MTDDASATATFYGLCQRWRARKSTPMSREVLRFERPKPMPAAPALRHERPDPSKPRPPVIGMTYMHSPGMTCQERHNVESMARDLHDACSRISYHHHNIADMSEMVDVVCCDNRQNLSQS